MTELSKERKVELATQVQNEIKGNVGNLLWDYADIFSLNVAEHEYIANLTVIVAVYVE